MWHYLFGQKVCAFHSERPLRAISEDFPVQRAFGQSPESDLRADRKTCPDILANRMCHYGPRLCSKTHPNFLDGMWVPFNYPCQNFFRGLCTQGDECHHVHGDVFPEALFKAVQEQKRVRLDGFLNYKQTVGRLQTVDRATADGLIIDSLGKLWSTAISRFEIGCSWCRFESYTCYKEYIQASNPPILNTRGSRQRTTAIGTEWLVFVISQSKRATTYTLGRLTPAFPKAHPLTPPQDVSPPMTTPVRLRHHRSRTCNHRILLPAFRLRQLRRPRLLLLRRPPSATPGIPWTLM